MPGFLLGVQCAPMVNHPNRDGRPGRNPTPDEIRALREAHGLSEQAAAALVYTTAANWIAWETERSHANARRMHPAFWELFERKVRELPPNNAAEG